MPELKPEFLPFLHAVELAFLFGAAAAFVVIFREAPAGAWKQPGHYAKAFFFFIAGTLSLGIAGAIVLVMLLALWLKF